MVATRVERTLSVTSVSGARDAVFIWIATILIDGLRRINSRFSRQHLEDSFVIVPSKVDSAVVFDKA